MIQLPLTLSSDGKTRHPCGIPYCKAKPFTRHYDLKRHFSTIHQGLGKVQGGKDQGDKQQNSKVQPRYGPTANSLNNTPKVPYQRPKHVRVFCTLCNEFPDGFRG
jgi:hypothetical protein